MRSPRMEGPRGKERGGCGLPSSVGKRAGGLQRARYSPPRSQAEPETEKKDAKKTQLRPRFGRVRHFHQPTQVIGQFLLGDRRPGVVLRRDKAALAGERRHIARAERQQAKVIALVVQLERRE